jgi:protoporphyrinogen oxidase
MYDIIVIGGGISGLYFLHRLHPSSKILLLEKEDHVGGKLRTEYNKKREVLYEKGPWRISIRHHLILSLAQKLGLTIKKIPQGKHVFINDNQKIKDSGIPSAPPIDPGLSVWDSWCVAKDKKYATLYEEKTGYTGIFDMSSSINAYDAQKKNPEEYCVLEEGFFALIYRLYEKLSQKNIYTSFFVNNVIRIKEGYQIEGIHREGSNTFVSKIFKTSKIVVACPPSTLKNWSISKHLEPILASITTYPLMHIYGFEKKKKTTRVFSYIYE